MTTAFWCVFIAGLLPYVSALAAKVGARDFDNNEPRLWLAKQQGFRARANAAQQNAFEAFAFFAAAVVVAHLVHGPQARVDQLAMVFIAARVVYVPVYLAGWGAVRSLVWLLGMAATVWIFLMARGVSRAYRFERDTFWRPNPDCPGSEYSMCAALRRLVRRCNLVPVSPIPKAPEIAQLSVSDRLDLMDEIWASLAPRANSIPLPEWHVAEIKRRLAALAVDGNHGRTADEVFAELKRWL